MVKASQQKACVTILQGLKAGLCLEYNWVWQKTLRPEFLQWRRSRKIKLVALAKAILTQNHLLSMTILSVKYTYIYMKCILDYISYLYEIYYAFNFSITCLFFLLMWFVEKMLWFFNSYNWFPILFHFSWENSFGFKLCEWPIALVKPPSHCPNLKTHTKEKVSENEGRCGMLEWTINFTNREATLGSVRVQEPQRDDVSNRRKVAKSKLLSYFWHFSHPTHTLMFIKSV